MQSLNALGNRQITSLNADLSRMESGEGGSAIQGELHASSTMIENNYRHGSCHLFGHGSDAYLSLSRPNYNHSQCSVATDRRL